MRVECESARQTGRGSPPPRLSPVVANGTRACSAGETAEAESRGTGTRSMAARSSYNSWKGSEHTTGASRGLPWKSALSLYRWLSRLDLHRRVRVSHHFICRDGRDPHAGFLERPPRCSLLPSLLSINGGRVAAADARSPTSGCPPDPISPSSPLETRTLLFPNSNRQGIREGLPPGCLRVLRPLFA